MSFHPIYPRTAPSPLVRRYAARRKTTPPPSACAGLSSVPGTAAHLVGVRDGARQRTLRKHPDASALPDEFEWGYECVGPGVLAEAILADRLGFNPDPAVSTAFAREVVAQLESEFELPGREVDDWLARRRPAVARDAAARFIRAWAHA